jgi:hypothetical protein
MAVDIESIENLYDKLMAKVDASVNDQFTKGRLTGTTFANVYLGALQSVVQQSVTATMQQELNTEKIETENKNQLLLDKELDIKTYQESTLLVDEHNANTEKIETENKNQEQIMAQTAQIKRRTI